MESPDGTLAAIFAFKKEVCAIGLPQFRLPHGAHAARIRAETAVAAVIAANQPFPIFTIIADRASQSKVNAASENHSATRGRDFGTARIRRAKTHNPSHIAQVFHQHPATPRAGASIRMASD